MFIRFPSPLSACLILCLPSSPPPRSLIDKDVSIPPETFRKHVDTSLTYINRALKQMSRLFLVEDLVDSLKVRTSNAASATVHCQPHILLQKDLSCRVIIIGRIWKVVTNQSRAVMSPFIQLPPNTSASLWSTNGLPELTSQLRRIPVSIQTMTLWLLLFKIA